MTLRLTPALLATLPATLLATGLALLGLALLGLTLLGLALPTVALAQTACSSDGQRPPKLLLERFLSADCLSCWQSAPTGSATPNPTATATADTSSGKTKPGAPGKPASTHNSRTVVLDWIVPSPQGEDAPLAAAASRDSLSRLNALGLSPPKQSEQKTSAVVSAASAVIGAATPSGANAAPGKPAPALRVVRGLAFNDYIGVSIQFRAPSPGNWTLWLALIETLPAGTEASPVPRQLVRNLLQVQTQTTAAKPLREARSMQIPAGAQAERLGVVGWVEDDQGRLRALAQSHCKTQR